MRDNNASITNVFRIRLYDHFLIFNLEVAHDTDLVQKCMIGMAKQQGTNVCVYSETGSFMFNKTGNLVGYTSNTVTVKQGGTTYVYGEHGEIKFTK